jgi:hypothetical protein
MQAALRQIGFVCTLRAMSDTKTKWRPTLDATTRVVRINVTIPRELLAAYKAKLDGAPLSTALAEMMEKALAKK